MAFCGKCGTGNSPGAGFCNNCGQPIDVQARIAGAMPAQSPRVAEQKFFEGDGVLVTNTRLVKGGETFAMSGVTSVRAHTVVPSKKGPIFFIVIGGITLLASLQSSLVAALIGVALIGLGIWWFRSIKNVYHVRLVTSSGERDAINSHSMEYIANIVSAVNQAIIHRG